MLGLRMIDVAKSVGCSESFISKIESGRAKPSLNMLHHIARALNTNIGQLFVPLDGENASVVLRQGQRPVLSGQIQSGITIERLIPHMPGNLLQGNIHHLEPGASSQGTISHPGEEFGYILSGTVELTVATRRYQLEPGDSFHFRSESEHSYRNTGRSVARILSLSTPPTY